MSGVDRVAEVIHEALHATGFDYHAAAEAVAAELQLTEEVSVRVGQLSGCVMSPHDLESHHTVIARRWVSAWSAAEEKP